MKPPAYAKDLLTRRQSGERIGLLVVGVQDWEFGQRIAERPNVARLVVPHDALPHTLDWSCAVALDCLVGGECPPAVFMAAAVMLSRVGAASVWGDFDDGIWLLAPLSDQARRRTLVATEGPVAPNDLPGAIRNYRERCLLTRAGVYGTPAFDPARAALYETIFGPLAAKAQQWVAEQRGWATRRTA